MDRTLSGLALVAGGAAWLSKLAVIVATDGRVTQTGAAAAFLDRGLVLLMVGHTGVGLRLAMNQAASMRVVLALASPLIFGVLFTAFAAMGYVILGVGGTIAGVAVPGYLLEEGGVVVSAAVGVVVGVWLVVGVVRRGATRGASGSREAGLRVR